MVLRELHKLNKPNDGSRKLLESALVPEVAKAMSDWIKNIDTNLKYVLVGGVGLSYWVKPRYTTDSDFLFLTSADIPKEVTGFKRIRPGAFEHKQTGVEIEVLTPESIGMSTDLAKAIYENAVIRDGVKIATPSGLIASKLKRFKTKDRADIEELYELGNIDLSPYPLTPQMLKNFEITISELGE